MPTPGVVRVPFRETESYHHHQLRRGRFPALRRPTGGGVVPCFNSALSRRGGSAATMLTIVDVVADLLCFNPLLVGEAALPPREPKFSALRKSGFNPLLVGEAALLFFDHDEWKAFTQGFQPPSRRGGSAATEDMKRRIRANGFQSPSRRGGSAARQMARRRPSRERFNPLLVGEAALPPQSGIDRLRARCFDPLLVGEAALPHTLYPSRARVMLTFQSPSRRGGSAAPSSAKGLLTKHFESRILRHFLSKGLSGCSEKQPPGAGERLSI